MNVNHIARYPIIVVILWALVTFLGLAYSAPKAFVELYGTVLAYSLLVYIPCEIALLIIRTRREKHLIIMVIVFSLIAIATAPIVINADKSNGIIPILVFSLVNWIGLSGLILMVFLLPIRSISYLFEAVVIYVKKRNQTHQIPIPKAPVS